MAAKSYVGVIRTLNDAVFELRKKLMLILLLVVAGSVVGWLNVNAVLAHFATQVPNIITTGPTEAFTAKLRIAITIGIMLTLPFILYILVDFFKKRFPKLAIKNTTLMIVVACVLFLIGVAMAWFFIIPLAVKFLLGYSTEDIRSTLSLGKYVSFVSMLVLVFGFAFEMPLVLNMLTSAGYLKSQQLISKGKYVVLIIFVIAAFVTPPDVISQILLAVPLLILYGVCIVLARRREKQQKKTQDKKIQSGEAVAFDAKGVEITDWSEETQRRTLAASGLSLEDQEDFMRQIKSGEIFGQAPEDREEAKRQAREQAKEQIKE